MLSLNCPANGTIEDAVLAIGRPSVIWHHHMAKSPALKPPAWHLLLHKVFATGVPNLIFGFDVLFALVASEFLDE